MDDGAHGAHEDVVGIEFGAVEVVGVSGAGRERGRGVTRIVAARAIVVVAVAEGWGSDALDASMETGVFFCFYRRICVGEKDGSQVSRSQVQLDAHRPKVIVLQHQVHAAGQTPENLAALHGLLTDGGDGGGQARVGGATDGAADFGHGQLPVGHGNAGH